MKINENYYGANTNFTSILVSMSRLKKCSKKVKTLFLFFSNRKNRKRVGKVKRNPLSSIFEIKEIGKKKEKI